MSKPRKKIFILLVLVILIALSGYHIHNSYRITDLALDFSPSGFERHNRRLREQLHYSNYKFRYADDLERQAGSWDAFSHKDTGERCKTFFKFLDQNMSGWDVKLFQNEEFNKDIDKKERYFKSHLEVIKNLKVAKDPEAQLTDSDYQKTNKMYEEELRKSTGLERDMADTMTIIRIFGHCFFSPDSPPIEGELKEIYHRYSAKVVPFLNPEIPQTSQGDIMTNAEWPFDNKEPVESGNLLDFYYKNMHGTGIAISAATRHSRDLIKLIHVLRALGNTLPIEVMYRSDILLRSKTAILLSGSLTKEELLGDEMTDLPLLQSIFDSLGMSMLDLESMPFPTQKITLVNMDKPLSRLSKNDYHGYNNKILALFFNSFEKTFLFDTDAVPLISPETLGTLQEFLDSGAYFFRDRTLLDTNDWIETNYFAKLMPHESDRLDMAMGIKPVTSHTLGNMYMKGWRHCQEAGVVMIDRKRHFRALLTLMPLPLWGNPTKSLIWGDKELYWLAMSMAGDEDYVFNKYGAASVGEVTSNSMLKHYNNTRAQELCSTHPGHVSADGQLLWINSGFSYCKKNGFERDRDTFPFSVFSNRDEMRELYKNPLKIRQAIVPPELPPLRTPDGSADLSVWDKFKKVAKKRKQDVDDEGSVDQIDSYDPQKGWIKGATCSGYEYCAYNSMEAYDNSGKLDESGSFFDFDPENTKRFDVLGAIWLTSQRVNKLKEVKQDDSSASKALDTNEKADSQNQSTDSKANDSKDSKDLGNEQDGADRKDAMSKPDSKPELKELYDPSQAMERPEKLGNDVKAALSNLFTSNESV